MTSNAAEPRHHQSLESRSLVKKLLTILGTVGGGTTLIYAGVLEGYGHFYYALGLRLSNISLSTEQVLAPMALIALVFTVLLAVVALGLWFGVAAATSARRREQPIATYIVVLVVILVTAIDWRPAPELVALIGLTHLLGMIGPIAVAPSQKKASTKEGSEQGRILKLMTVFWPFPILTAAGIVLEDLPRLALPIAQVALIVIVLIAGRLWLRWHGGPIATGDPVATAADGIREVRQFLTGGKIRRFALIAATAFAIALTPIGLIEKWETDLWERGLDARQYGYTDIENYEILHPEGLRPITLTRNDPAQDPLGLCQDQVYAASLVEPSTNQQWLLLRPVDGPGDAQIRVVPLPADAYNYQLESIPQPASDGTPAMWTTDACRDRE